MFVPPNRYIFHGAEVYSDSEDDALSSSSCGSNSDSGTCQSPSLEEPLEDESEIEEFYNGLEDDADRPECAGGSGADGGDQEAANEAIATRQELTDVNCPSDKSERYWSCPGTGIAPPALGTLACQKWMFTVNLNKEIRKMYYL